MDENNVLHDSTGNPWRQREIFLNGRKRKTLIVGFLFHYIQGKCVERKGKAGVWEAFLMVFCLEAGRVHAFVDPVMKVLHIHSTENRSGDYVGFYYQLQYHT
jgi:hypothetical protein